MTPESVRAFVAEKNGDQVERRVEELPIAALSDDASHVGIRVLWSGVNYKDGLATRADGRVARISPLTPGIDLAGIVEEPGSSGLSVGDEVVVHGYDLGVAHHGGFAQYARVPAEWVVPLAGGLSPRDAMIIGTAGFTAALSIYQLETAGGLARGDGPVLVTGATGGVGSVAVAILAARGYSVTASTGKVEAAAEWLRALGATEVIGRDELTPSGRPLDKERWAAAVDCVGGPTLAYVIATLRTHGSVAASGNTGGADLPTTVFPFILRGVSLLGVDSAQCPMPLRREIWRRLADDLRPPDLESIVADVVGLDELETALDRVLAGGNRGRTLVDLGR